MRGHWAKTRPDRGWPAFNQPSLGQPESHNSKGRFSTNSLNEQCCRPIYASISIQSPFLNTNDCTIVRIFVHPRIIHKIAHIAGKRHPRVQHQRSGLEGGTRANKQVLNRTYERARLRVGCAQRKNSQLILRSIAQVIFLGPFVLTHVDTASVKMQERGLHLQ